MSRTNRMKLGAALLAAAILLPARASRAQSSSSFTSIRTESEQSAAGVGPQPAPPAPGQSADGLPKASHDDPTGAFAGAVPLVVPPFHGIEPKLALVYHSG